MRDLIGKLEKLDGPSREVDRIIHAVTTPPLRGELRFGYVPIYTASLDAAIALVERVLPGWSFMLDNRLRPQAKLLPPGQISSADERSTGETIAIALLIALLKAKEAQDG